MYLLRAEQVRKIALSQLDELVDQVPVQGLGFRGLGFRGLFRGLGLRCLFPSKSLYQGTGLFEGPK